MGIKRVTRKLSVLGLGIGVAIALSACSVSPPYRGLVTTQMRFMDGSTKNAVSRNIYSNKPGDFGVDVVGSTCTWVKLGDGVLLYNKNDNVTRGFVKTGSSGNLGNGTHAGSMLLTADRSGCSIDVVVGTTASGANVHL